MGLNYSFDVDYATEYGVDEAILLQNLIFWIIKNKACEKHYYEGRTWTYNSAKSFEVLFPFWNEKQIRRIIDSLKEQKVIITGNFNKIAYDRTLWYALKDEAIIQKGQIHFPKTGDQLPENGSPIPDINTDSKPKNKQVKKPALTDIEKKTRDTTITLVEFHRKSLYPTEVDIIYSPKDWVALSVLCRMNVDEIRKKLVILRRLCKDAPKFYKMMPHDLLKQWSRLTEEPSRYEDA